jgi:ACT domain-containing protein
MSIQKKKAYPPPRTRYQQKEKVVRLQVSMKLEMKDSPGQLVAALTPISEFGGNIIAVIHQREPESSSDALGVQIVLEIAQERLDALVAAIKLQGVSILRLGEERLLYRQSVIMIGHLIHTDIGDTIGRIDATGFAEVAELNVHMPAIAEPSTALITIKATTRSEMERALDLLRQVAAEKGLLIVEPLGGAEA